MMNRTGARCGTRCRQRRHHADTGNSDTIARAVNDVTSRRQPGDTPASDASQSNTRAAITTSDAAAADQPNHSLARRT